MALQKLLEKARETSYRLPQVPDADIKKVLNNLAVALVKNEKNIIAENKKDLVKISPTDPIFDRMMLNSKRIRDIAASIKVVAAYPSPINKILEEHTGKNGLRFKKVTVPIGVITAIFEARPNVVIDIFSICFKSKNVCILKGSRMAENSNNALVKIIKKVLLESKISDIENSVMLLDNKPATFKKLLMADKYVDLVIPRGGQGLIKFVRDNSIIPVIETGAGVVHTYFDDFGKTEMGAKIVYNAKISRPSLCNALDTLVIHKKRLKDLVKIVKPLQAKEVLIFADNEAYKILKGKYPFLEKAKKESFGKEYLSLKMSVKTVNNIDEAINHINNFGTHHSETIITENKKNAEKFLNEVDAAAVYVNASTRFTDGGEFGLGAEIGISTQKLHARGPMGINELTSYKWEIWGNGQVR